MTIQSNLDARSEDKIKVRKFLIDLSEVITETESHIEKKGYVKNSKLARKWKNLILHDIPKIENIAGFMRNGQFWDNPEPWMEHEGSMELIPKLAEYRDLLGRLIEELK